MEHKQDKTVMPWILAKAYGEEPDALIALVRVCGGAFRKLRALPGKKNKKFRIKTRSQVVAQFHVFHGLKTRS